MSDTSQATDQTQIADEFIIDSLETLKVIADPLRKRIMEHFDTPKTVKEVAKLLNTTPSKLYYHVNLLEEHGLLKVTDTRIVSGIIEKHYQKTAHMLKVKTSLISPTGSDEGLNVLLSNVLDSTADEIRASVRAGVIDVSSGNAPTYRSLFLSFLSAQLTVEQAERFYEGFKALINEINEIDTDDSTPGAQDYIIQIAMFPSSRPATIDDLLPDDE
jgi:hypothetical protein